MTLKEKLQNILNNKISAYFIGGTLSINSKHMIVNLPNLKDKEEIYLWAKVYLKAKFSSKYAYFERCKIIVKDYKLQNKLSHLCIN